MSCLIYSFVLCFSFIACVRTSQYRKYGGFMQGSQLIYTAKREVPGRELWAGQYPMSTEFDDLDVLKVLYGNAFNPEDTTGSGGIFVFGNHNTGTSMLARLIMLMGAFQGNLEGLSTSPKNRLKYWEKLDVSHFHDLLLRKYSDPRFKPYHAQGLDLSTMSREDRDRLSAFAGRVVADQNRHRPWLLKDPRMVSFADVWIAKEEKPVCVVTHKDPIRNALSLHSNHKKSAQLAGEHGSAEMTVERWLTVWENGMLSVLFACLGRPTVLVEAESLSGDIGTVSARIYGQLVAAGVVGLMQPSSEQLAVEFGSYLKPARKVEAETAVHMTPTQEALDFALKKALQLTEDGAIRSPSQTVQIVLDLWKSVVNRAPGEL